MALNDNVRLTPELKRYASDDMGPLTLGQRLTLQEKEWDIAAESAADDALTTAQWKPETREYKLVSARLISRGDVTASATVYGTVAIKVGSTVLASLTTNTTGNGGTGDWSANSVFDLTLSTTAANLEVDADDRVDIVVAKASTGTQLPAYRICTVWAERADT